MPISQNTSLIQVNLDDIQQNFTTYLRQVETGMTLLIIKAGKPMAEIKPINSTEKGLRPFGLCSGEFTVPDDFDEPLPEQIIRDFEGK